MRREEIREGGDEEAAISSYEEMAELITEIQKKIYFMSINYNGNGTTSHDEDVDVSHSDPEKSHLHAKDKVKSKFSKNTAYKSTGEWTSSEEREPIEKPKPKMNMKALGGGLRAKFEAMKKKEEEV